MFRESQGLFSSMSQLFLTVLDMPALDEDIDPAKTTLRDFVAQIKFLAEKYRNSEKYCVTIEARIFR